MTNHSQQLEDFNACIRNQEHFALYFTDGKCSVAKSIGPKLYETFSNQYPNIKLIDVIIPMSEALSGHLNIFSAPCLMVYFDGKLQLKMAGTFGISELNIKLGRLYDLRFN
ncbi:MAG: thioredoxin family protein [Flavobacteriales bacterium]